MGEYWVCTRVALSFSTSAFAVHRARIIQACEASVQGSDWENE